MSHTKKIAVGKPEGTLSDIRCRSCGQPRAINDYRLFSTDPKVHFDFCVWCEQKEGTLTLYRRFNAYGTAHVIDAVFAVARVPAIRRTAEQARILVEPSEGAPSPQSKEEVVAHELARRELCRRRLLYYTTTMMPSYQPGWMHQDLCRRLERFMLAVERGESPRLIVEMPPRSGKTLQVSDMFPSWMLGHHPEWPIVLSSYAQDLPVQSSRNVRDRITSPEYQAIFPSTVLRSDAKGVEAWRTTKHGGIKAVGVGVGLTGHGAMVAVNDDLLKDSEAASSEVIRKNTWEWYQMVLRTRLAPGGGIIICATRWHWHDPTGLALEQDEALKKAGVPEYERENWEVVSYPAIAENDEYLMNDGTIAQGVYDEEREDVVRLLRKKGEALHAERYPLRELLKLKNTMTAANWSALYQQKPSPDEGDFFKRDDIRYRWLDPAYRPLCRIFMCADYAIGKKQRNDFTVAGVYALTADDDLYCLEKRRGRWGTSEISDNFIALIERHKPELFAGEQGQIHMAVWPTIQKELDKRRLYISVDETLVPMQDKEVRARPLQGRTQRRKFYYSYDSATRPDVYDINEREMMQFPNGAHDDCVDCDSWAARLALNIALPATQALPTRLPGWQEKLLSGQRSNTHFMAA